MDLKDRLRLLKRQILEGKSGHQAFKTWEEIKPHLSSTQRVSILTAWNVYLRTDDERPLIESIQDAKENH